MRKSLAVFASLLVGLATIGLAYVPSSSGSQRVTYSDVIDDDEVPEKANHSYYKQYPKFLADVNGDGIRDFCRGVGGAPATLACQIGKENGFFKTKEYQGPRNMNWGNANQKQWMEDVNDDDRADFCRFIKNQAVATLAEDDAFADDLVRIKKTSQGWRLAN